ncbi:putative cysteine-rich receptor-like protein kinase 9 [Rutidosis leptorrhynchoides]|uniref:putative cysteine-rich receptor-like protein kinase 9 n=1 Tax=Rutidosis leptorrhynchoides TaxID=125765 RepID=UPI003A9969AF
MYHEKLKIALSHIDSLNNGYGFFYDNLDVDKQETIFTEALCRGDVEHNLCNICVNDAFVNLVNLCPNHKNAIIYREKCMLRYSNETNLFDALRLSLFRRNDESSNDVGRFTLVVHKLIKNLIVSAAAGDSRLKYASGNTSGPNRTKIYGLVQCVPILVTRECIQCLNEAYNYKFNGLCHGRTGCYGLTPVCSLRYETYQFYNGSTTRPALDLAP